MLRPDGTELPVEVFLTRIDLRGRRLLQTVFNDITERKRAEAEIARERGAAARERGALQDSLSRKPFEHHDFAVERCKIRRSE